MDGEQTVVTAPRPRSEKRRRAEMVACRLDSNEHERLVALAEREEVSLATILRRALQRELGIA